MGGEGKKKYWKLLELNLEILWGVMPWFVNMGLAAGCSEELVPFQSHASFIGAEHNLLLRVFQVTLMSLAWTAQEAVFTAARQVMWSHCVCLFCGDFLKCLQRNIGASHCLYVEIPWASAQVYLRLALLLSFLKIKQQPYVLVSGTFSSAVGELSNCDWS